MVKKLFKILRKFKSSNLFFVLPKKVDLIIFDKSSIADFKKYLLKDEDCFILKTRYEDIDEIFLSPKIILKFIINFYKIYKEDFLIQDLYFFSLIQVINPKIVLTFTDNSFQFSKICRANENKKIKFIALQNGNRLQWHEQSFIFENKLISQNLNEVFFIPHLLCFGEHEKNDAIKFNLNIKKFSFVGSLRLANFLNDVKLNKTKINYNKYDICLISDFGTFLNKYQNIEMDKITNAGQGIIKLFKYTINFARENDLKLVIAFKGNPRKKESQKEQNWYKENLTKEEYYYVSNHVEPHEEYSSYKNSFESKIVVAITSTLLRENIACENKILSCNLTKNNLYDFPIKGICSISNCDYNQFSDRITSILRMEKNDYFSKIDKDKNYLCHYDNPEKCFKEIKVNILENLKTNIKNC